MSLVARVMGRTPKPTTQRFVSREQLKEAKDLEARKLADALNTDYLD